MKTSKQYALQKSVMSQETFKNTLTRDIETLRAECDIEITRLTRLRNEIKDIESQLKNLAAGRAKLLQDREAFQKESDLVRGDLNTLNLANTKKIEEAKQYLAKANQALKDADARLQTADVIEKRNAASALVNEARIKKAQSIETKNEKSVQILVDQQTKTETMLAAAKTISLNNRLQLAEINTRLDDLAKEQAAINASISTNDALVAKAKLSEAKAQEVLNQARLTAEASQLSVDKQWNEIEIQKQALKVRELKINKLIADKGIKDELKKLEGA